LHQNDIPNFNPLQHRYLSSGIHRGCTNITLKLKTSHKVSCITTSQRRISSGRQTKLQTTYKSPFLQQSVLPGLEQLNLSAKPRGYKDNGTPSLRLCEGIHGPSSRSQGQSTSLCYGPTTRRRRRLGALRERVLGTRTRICGRQKSQNAS
jgi:hypothetical protein